MIIMSKCLIWIPIIYTYQTQNHVKCLNENGSYVEKFQKSEARLAKLTSDKREEDRNLQTAELHPLLCKMRLVGTIT